MGFEVYKPRIKNTNLIALTKNHIILKPDILEKLNTNSVELAYDRNTRVIRIRPADLEEDGFVINNNKIGARGFYKFFDIGIKGKFPFKMDDSDNAVLIDISNSR